MFHKMQGRYPPKYKLQIGRSAKGGDHVKKIIWKGGGFRQFLKEQGPALIMFIAVALIVIIGAGNAAGVQSEQEIQMAEDSVRRAVVSCYAIEGAYPESFAYLKEHYGITVDETKYAVHYEVFAENIMPEITVTELAAD